MALLGMKAITVRPRHPGTAQLSDIPEPDPRLGPVLVQTLEVGVCGTDREIIKGEYGVAPRGEDYLVIGHESLGRVIEGVPSGEIAAGDLVVGIVRTPDPVPCSSCAAGEWDMCQNGLYTEHGIKELHGFCAERFRLEPNQAVKIGSNLEDIAVLVEPASVVAKAWDHIDRIGHRAHWNPKRVLVTGAGPIGLLAALMGVQRGLEVHVLDLAEEGLKPQLVRDLGAIYHASDVAGACKGADIVLECTGVGQLVYDVMECNAPNGIVCLTGISTGGRKLQVDMTALNRSMVLENAVVFGTVNANRRHYAMAVDSLSKAERSWIRRLITRRVPLSRWDEILNRTADDIKSVIQFFSPSMCEPIAS